MSLKPQTLLRKTTTPFLRERESHSGRSFSCRTPIPSSSPPLSFLHRSSLRLPRNPHSKVVQGLRFDGPVMDFSEISEMEDGDFEMETCIIRTLPPAITLEQGIERIKEAMENLKLNPPSSTSSGFFRFQVAVPPSAKALNWFCIQPESSSVFPLFFISKDTNEPSYKSLVLNETRGVFGIGSAVYFERNRYGASGERTMPKRFVSLPPFNLWCYFTLNLYLEENLLDVEEQLRFLLHEIKGAEINCFLPLLRGSFSSWIWTNLGIPPSSLFPSVRCGLEMAILNALAARQGYDLLSLLHVQKDEVIAKESSKVQICGLVDSNGTPTEVADIVAKLVQEGFAAIKLKVARRRSPTQDARVIQEVREKIGYQVELRADANRNWTYKEAIEFGSLVKDCDLQYIEVDYMDN
ncbi:Enolase N-terminal domain-like [Trema orientale]|uniref:Enolase N-terminal domain-like n=1 Tax=Trema orientale TaxID=63057 RepID=A0A2P5DU14_TREOI|nr:Enolase N-terminal domain-like [Trema orientale]